MTKEMERFRGGSWDSAYTYLGAHPAAQGYTFRVWAPHARHVALAGDFNGWQGADMHRDEDGVWSLTAENAAVYDAYKYVVTGADGRTVWKADPFAFHAQTRPGTDSKVYDLSDYGWHDGAWREKRAAEPPVNGPLLIYEVHLGSWRRHEDGTSLSYRELARQLPTYVRSMGYNFVELLPVTEYPLDDSWGYQCTGYFAPTSRYGTPHDFMALVDALHQAGLGVILDWVPAHFCKDSHGLIEFDGTCLYEYGDPLKWEHTGWGTRVFDFGKPEVCSFLLSSAAYWLREYHIDGLRVDAVASMLYLDYDRQGGAWTPNQYGGHENLEAIEFLRELNTMAFQTDPSVLMIAEESTAWPLVTRPPDVGGLGFNLKWNMGWMNDMCHYLKLDPYFRQYNHKDITFSIMYAFTENFICPLSHDEVVHGKKSMLDKMYGTYEQKFATLRALYGYQFAHPGKKLTFMGSEFGQFIECNYKQGLDWLLLGYEKHQKMQHFVRTLNHFYLENRCFWENDSDWDGFRWLSCDDRDNSIVAFRRISRKGQELIAVCNFCPVLRESYRLPLPKAGWYQPVLNTDDAQFGGFDFQPAPVHAEKDKQPQGEYAYSGAFRVPPMSVCFYKHVRKKPEK